MVVSFFAVAALSLYQLADLPLNPKMTISSLLKGFSSFKFGLLFNYLMKIGTTILLTVLLVGVGKVWSKKTKSWITRNSGSAKEII